MSKNAKGLFTRSAAARAAGCSMTTLVNYERRKIIRPQRLRGDTGQGYPVYSQADVDKARTVYDRRPNKPRSER